MTNVHFCFVAWVFLWIIYTFCEFYRVSRYYLCIIYSGHNVLPKLCLQSEFEYLPPLYNVSKFVYNNHLHNWIFKTSSFAPTTISTLPKHQLPLSLNLASYSLNDHSGWWQRWKPPQKLIFFQARNDRVSS